MADLSLTRHFAADPEAVFRAVSDPAFLTRWWGHERGWSAMISRIDRLLAT